MKIQILSHSNTPNFDNIVNKVVLFFNSCLVQVDVCMGIHKIYLPYKRGHMLFRN